MENLLSMCWNILAAINIDSKIALFQHLFNGYKIL